MPQVHLAYPNGIITRLREGDLIIFTHSHSMEIFRPSYGRNLMISDISKEESFIPFPLENRMAIENLMRLISLSSKLGYRNAKTSVHGYLFAFELYKPE